MADKKVRVAIIGLGFGAEFIPIYQNHPQAEMYAICQRTQEKLDQIGDAFGVGRAVHEAGTTCWPIRTSTPSTSTRPFPITPPQSLAGLQAGKHVACTVPMATTVDECRAIWSRPSAPAASTT